MARDSDNWIFDRIVFVNIKVCCIAISLLFVFTNISANENEWKQEEQELEQARKEEVRKHDPSWIYTESYEFSYNFGIVTKNYIKKWLKFDEDKE